MSANVETMFYTRQKPWHGLGTRVEEAPGSKEALTLAGLDWKVVQKPIQTEEGQPILGFKANIRDLDGQILGVVTDRYKVVQNEDVFFVKYFSLKKASEFPFFSKGFSLPSAGIMHPCA